MKGMQLENMGLSADEVVREGGGQNSRVSAIAISVTGQ